MLQPPIESATQSSHSRNNTMVDVNWRNEIERTFGDYESPELESAWQAVIQSLKLGQSGTGEVVARAPYGAWIDLGVGFPALLQIIMMRDMDHETYLADEWCPVGSQVEAQVRILNDRQIGLEQFPFDVYLRAKSELFKENPDWWKFWKK